jgi:hypothetical protein
MATTGNINPWAAGAVVLDTRPFAAFYERQMVRQQAKQDALDNYFRDLNKNVTSAGMRSQDVPGLLQKQKDWQDYYQQNKAAIGNPKMDNGQAYNEYMARYQDQLGLVNQSKDEHKKKDELNKLRFNKDFSYVFEDPNIVKDIASDDLPIGDPNRKRLDIASLTIPPKPLDVKELDAYNKYLTGGIPHDKIPGETEYMKGFKTRTPIIAQYSPENQIAIGQHAMNAYDTDRRWRYEADKTFKNLIGDPEMYKQFNTVYKKLYGNDIDSPREAWAAKGILDNNMKATEYKDGTDEWGRDNAMRQLRQADAKELIRYKNQIDPNDTDMNNVWYESYFNKLMDNAKTSGVRHHLYKGDGKSLLYYKEIKPDPYLMKSLMRGKSEPDRVGVTDSGEIIPIFFKYKSEKEGGGVETLNGKPVIDDDYSKPMSVDQALVNLGYRGSTKKQLREDQHKIQAGKLKDTSPGKPKTVVQNGHTYTLNESTGQYE